MTARKAIRILFGNVPTVQNKAEVDGQKIRVLNTVEDGRGRPLYRPVEIKTGRHVEIVKVVI